MLLVATARSLIFLHLISLTLRVLALVLCQVNVLTELLRHLLKLLEVTRIVILKGISVLQLLLNRYGVALNCPSILDLSLASSRCRCRSGLVQLNVDLLLLRRYIYMCLSNYIVLDGTWLNLIIGRLYPALLALIDEYLVGIGDSTRILGLDSILLSRFYL